jgi:phosphoglucosamine mutase
VKYFGTDGIRGKAYTFITEEMSFRIGKSLNHFKSISKKIYIARDTRISGTMIVENIKKGALLAGIDVCNLGVYATPLLAFASVKNDCIGVMVTASHNPYHDNGIKIFNRGEKSSDAMELLIEEVIDNDLDLANETPGNEFEDSKIIDLYFENFKDFDTTMNINVGLDLANGATTTSALKALARYVGKAFVIGDKPDGLNINLNCGSTHLEALQELVIQNQLDLGFAFDGDGDRVLVVDDLGEIIDGDLLIYIMAKYLKHHNLLNNDVVVLSKMSNLGIIRALNDLGIRVIQTEVGDKYIFKALDEEQGVLGGENSGHIINKHLFKTGDGVLNAWFILKVLNHFQIKLSVLKKEVTYYPDILINIKNIDKNLVNDEEVIQTVEKYKTMLGSDGKVLVRASGTEPLIRVSVSAKTEELVKTISSDLVNLIESKR